MFWIKKIVSRLLFPVPLCLELLFLGLVLLWFTRRQKTGKILVTVAAVLLAVLSHPVANLMLASLERRYPALHDPAAVCRSGPAACKWVVVLGGGYIDDPELPLTSRPSSSTLGRILEGVRVYKALPGSKLVLLVGDPAYQDDAQEAFTSLAVMTGVDRRDLVTARGRDTEDEADAIRQIVTTEPFVLVTSASHMPRAMAIYRARGMHPVAAPTDYLAVGQKWDAPTDYLPGVHGLETSERAVYETLGLLWAKLRRQIP
jgi:uncharacterized SAM-binding protein YcdF (DUF218 family)